jgi:hypothetical protein
VQGVIEQPVDSDPDFVVRDSSHPLHMRRKKACLVPPVSYAPTVKEIRKNKTREYTSIMKKRKYSLPKKKEDPPRVGAHMGSFSSEHQGYMFVFRASLTADVVMISPWSEPEANMVERAIVRADAATGLHREDVVQGKFEVTVSPYSQSHAIECNADLSGNRRCVACPHAAANTLSQSWH